jgi:hypothetical protein
MSQNRSVRGAGGAHLTLDEKTLSFTVRMGRLTCRTAGRGSDELAVSSTGKVSAMPLSAASERKVTPYSSGTAAGFRVDLGKFPQCDLALTLLLAVDLGHPELTIRVASREGESHIRHLRWPGPMESPVAAADQTTAIPIKQGALLPGDWANALEHVHNVNGGGMMYMPWWGQYGPAGGYLAVVETAADASVVVRHPAGGPTSVGVQWDPSLGRLSYARSIRYVFLAPCDFVSLAKAYRNHLKSRGGFVGLAEKIARTPALASLIGAPVVHANILSHIQPESGYYKPDDPAANHRLVSFRRRAEQLRKLRARGLRRAYVHLDGWGVRGYDNLHPDILPPCPEAGGWDGLRDLAETCREIAYRLVLHDQYRDYYLDAASFDLRHAVQDEHGHVPQHAMWFGGRQALLCASLAYDYVRRNYDEIAANGVPIDGAYLDVFASVDPDECFSPEHPMTRRECMDHRCRCFGLIRSRGGIISSEEPMDFAVPHIDLVHWGPYPSYPSLHGRGPALGTPAPLLNLVYHDSLIVPWMFGNGPDAWGPQDDDGAAQAVLNGAMPYLDIGPDDAQLRECLEVCKLHRRVALQEMIGHELLDPAGRRRRSIFADGTVVEADLDSGAWTCPDLAAGT